MRQLVITGAGGFLGTNLIKGALENSAFDEILALTSRPEVLQKQFPDDKRLIVCESNLISNGNLKFRSEDLIINCAYPRAMRGADVTSGLDYVESVFRASAEAQVKGIVNISSQSVYDPHRDHPARETDIPILTDEYAIGKYCMEMLLRNVCKDIPYTNIRMASLIGPGFDVRAPNKMVKYALEKGEITVQENNQRYGYLDVEDAVRGLIGILTMEPPTWKSVYNLGSENTYSLLNMAECISECVEYYTGTHIKVNIVKGDGELNGAISSKLLISDIGDFEFSNLKKSIEKIISHFYSQQKNL